MGRLTIRGGDLACRTPRARSESGIDSGEEVGLFEAIGKLRLSTRGTAPSSQHAPSCPPNPRSSKAAPSPGCK